MASSQTTVLIIEAGFYEDISNELVRGATEELRKRNIGFERVAVPGALEIPQALASAIAAGLFAKKGRYNGCVALGCVIREQRSTTRSLVTSQPAPCWIWHFRMASRWGMESLL